MARLTGKEAAVLVLDIFQGDGINAIISTIHTDSSASFHSADMGAVMHQTRLVQ